MTKFRKKPVVIEAVQFNVDVNPTSELEPIFDGAVRGTSYMEIHDLLGTSGCSKNEPWWSWSVLGVIETLEGRMVCEPGDWIIKGVNGEFYSCKPDIFEKTYEPA